MQKLSANKKGFSAVVSLLIIVVIALIVAAGMYVWHKGHKSKPISTTATTTTKASPSNSNASSAATDPYLGWKTYCDTIYDNCFQYPSGWNLTTDSSEGVSASVRSPDNTALVNYDSPDIKDTGTSPFYAVDIEGVKADPSRTVVGGFYPANYLPLYYVFDSSQLNTYPLTVGETATFPFTPRFTDKSSSGHTAEFMASPIGTSQPYTNNEQAKAWFSSDDARTSLLILESLYSN